jgi:hypothetical protein
MSGVIPVAAVCGTRKQKLVLLSSVCHNLDLALIARCSQRVLASSASPVLGAASGSEFQASKRG